MGCEAFIYRVLKTNLTSIFPIGGCKMKTVWIVILLTMAVALYGCGPSQTGSEDSPAVPTVEPQNPATTVAPLPRQPVSPIQGVVTPMAPALATPYQVDLQNLIDIAVDDLAQRLSIPKAEIEVIAAYDVIWPDAGLGCSQSGMASAQVLTPGYLILLEHNTTTYEYHADKGTYVTYCANPSAPLVLPDQ